MKNHSITVRINETNYNQLENLAESMERSKSFIIEDALKNYIAVNAWQIAHIKKALAEADNPNTPRYTQEEIEREALA